MYRWPSASPVTPRMAGTTRPDDYIEIGQLLNLSPEAVRQRIGVDPMPAREADGAEVE